MGKPIYHQSEIGMYLKCGKQWEFRYALGIKEKPRAALTLGSSVDAAVTKNLKNKIDNKKLLPKEEVTQAFVDEFNKLEKDTDWQDDDPGKQKDMGVKMVELHHIVAAPYINPIAVQESFVVEVNGRDWNLGGTMDVVEKNVIRDTKTSKSAYDLNKVTKNYQAAIYDYAFEKIKGVKAKSFAFDVLIKPGTKKPADYQLVQAPVTKLDRDWTFDTIEQVHRSIDAGITKPAADSAWWCSSSWCGFWNQCKGKK
jgi:hypothetical protein